MSAPDRTAALSLPAWLRQGEDNMWTLAIHAQPGAKKSAVKGEHGERLKIALNAPPIDGKANATLCAFLAKRLELPKASVRLISGEKSREKRLAVIADLSAEGLLEALKTDG